MVNPFAVSRELRLRVSASSAGLRRAGPSRCGSGYCAGERRPPVAL